MFEFITITKALGDENRVRLLMALEGGERCVCQLVELLGLAPSTISKHIYLLKQARLVESRKEGRWVYYRLAASAGSGLVPSTLRWLHEGLREDVELERDRARLREILKLTPDTLCRRRERRQKRGGRGRAPAVSHSVCGR